MNNEQKRRGKRGDVKAWFDVIELFLYRLYMRHPAAAGRRVDREVVWLLPLPYGGKFTVTVLEQVWVPASHTLYVNLARPVVPVESV